MNLGVGLSCLTMSMRQARIACTPDLVICTAVCQCALALEIKACTHSAGRAVE